MGPTVFQIWRALQLPGEPNYVCRSPFSRGNEVCFVITLDGLRWVDCSTGEYGGPLRFMMLALDVGVNEATWLLRELVRDLALDAAAAAQIGGAK